VRSPKTEDNKKGIEKDTPVKPIINSSDKEISSLLLSNLLLLIFFEAIFFF
jgi:hypothetical protein